MGKISFVYADLLTAPELLIAHGCNSKGVAESGVAGALKKRWPDAFVPYHFACASGALQLGDVVWASVNTLASGSKLIGHVITQTTYGRDPATRYASYDAIERGLRAVLQRAQSEGLDAIAIPAIGAGLGNAPWSVVWPIFKHVVEPSPIDVNVYVNDRAQLEAMLATNARPEP